jgi:hypothetical protein
MNKLSRQQYANLLAQLKEIIDANDSDDLAMKCVYAVLQEWMLKGIQQIVIEKKEYKIKLKPYQKSALQVVFGDIETAGGYFFSMVYKLTESA